MSAYGVEADVEATLRGSAHPKPRPRTGSTEATTLAGLRATAAARAAAAARDAPGSGDVPGDDLHELGLLGEGGMGRVVLARQTSLAREVAIKVLHEDADARASAALVREARVTGALEHPAIVPIHALETDERGRPRLVMRRIEGVSWSELLADPEHPAWEGRATDGDRLAANVEILCQVAGAHALAVEARFGAREGLKLAPDDAESKAALRRTLRASVELELRSENVAAAEVLLRELTPPDDALDARVAAVREAATKRREETAHLRELARDRDPRLAPSVQPVFVLMLLWMIVGEAIPLATARGRDDPALRFVASVGIALLGSAFTVVALRKRLETTSHWALLQSLLAVEVVSFTNRLTGFLGGRPLAATLETDLLVGAVAIAAMAALRHPRFWLAALTALGGAAALATNEANAQGVYLGALSVVVAAVVWALRAPASAPAAPSSVRTSRGGPPTPPRRGG